MGLTVFVCSCCGKELRSSERDYCEKYDTRECAQCEYLHSLGIYTIEQYNAWLRK